MLVSIKMNITRAVSCVLFAFLYVINADPEIQIQVYEPQGLRAILTVPQPNNIKFVDFDGLVFRGVEAYGLGDFGTQTEDGDWIYEHPNWQSYIDDRILFDVFMSNYRTGFTNSTPLPQLHGNESSFFIFPGSTFRKRIVVKEILKDFKSRIHAEEKCVPSGTVLRNGTACSGQTIFEDNFDTDTLDADLWEIEHYIPEDHPEHPFVSYQRLESNPTVYVEDGKLYIQPRLQHTLMDFNNDIQSLISGTLDLSAGCTRRACVQRAVDVLPPVASGRVTSAFAFTYGIVTIRAKLPRGDWLYPEILLEPFANKYGSKNYASGVIKIAMALGNEDSETRNSNNKRLSGWLILNEKCHFAMRLNDARNWRKVYWSADFHQYSLKWTPGGMEFSVDGVTYGNYTINDFREKIPLHCAGGLQRVWTSDGRLAPFDEHFFITLGVAAGGMSEFPDRMQSNGKPKPWRNGSRKAVLNFLRDMDTWFPTWNNSALIIDSIKVMAL